jgi:hypothetical protein
MTATNILEEAAVSVLSVGMSGALEFFSQITRRLILELSNFCHLYFHTPV